jgi:hypothetical protein
MALIVEDGTGKADAESYISVADATAYHAARGNAAWAALASDAVREQMLRKATDYMEQAYSERWKGERATTDQALSWPRSGVHGVDSDVVPSAVSRACAELALRAISGDLAPDLSGQVKSETVGPISVTYADGARQQVKFQAVDSMLSALLEGSSITVKLVRV